MEGPAVKATGIAKAFGDVQALKEVDLRIANGELFGLVGPDGAGKTTLFRILASLLKPDKGAARVLGRDVVEEYGELRPLLGYMPGRFGLYEDLTVGENLKFFASVFRTTVEEGYALIEPIYRRLEPYRDRLAGNLSGGMKQKLALSCALVHRPRLLILDEPTTGVDAVSRKEFWEMLGEIGKQGITVAVSTPYMDEARLCDRVALMREGEILRSGSPGELIESFGKPLLAIRGERKYEIIRSLRTLDELASVQAFGDAIHVVPAGIELDVESIAGHLRSEGLGPVEAERISPGIEDLFIELTTGPPGDAHA